jgi:serine palmitoyltransferase
VTTPQSRRCLNLGSYNYLGFGGLNTHCTPLVRQAIMDHPITSGASSAEMGYSAPVKVGGVAFVPSRCFFHVFL